MLTISVVIPAYNSAKFIGETIQSILNQTEKPLEIIVVNDGSIDNTAEVVSQYPVRLINQKNQGVSAARNRGVIESKGEWIAFLDGDDLWLPKKLEITRLFIENNSGVEMTSTAFSVGSGNRPWVKVVPRKFFNSKFPFFNQLYRRSFIATSSVVVKKSALEKVGGFDTSLKAAEDLDLWLRMALAQTKYLFINEFLLYYRSHITSITANPLNHASDIKSVFLKYRQFAGYKLFIKRVFIWNISNALTLRGQGRYLSVVNCLFSAGLDLILSPFIYPMAHSEKKSKLISHISNSKL